jgi:polyphosphate kinase
MKIYQIKQQPTEIAFHAADTGWVMRITADRRIEVNEDVEVTEAAQKVLDAIQHLLTPQQRTWVGLTDDDKVLINHDANFNQFMTAGEYADRVQQLTEARLKDKNT